MWQLCRYLKKEIHGFIIWDNTSRDRKWSNEDKVMPQFVQEMADVLEQTREPRIKKQRVVAAYAAVFANKKVIKKSLEKMKAAKSKEEKEAQVTLSGADTKKYMAKGQIILNNCLNEGFLKEDKVDRGLVYLPSTGSKFAGVDGLIKEEIKILGVTWSVVVAVIVGGIGGFTVKSLWGLGIFLWKIISPRIGI